jgi:hypothetical protein
MSATSTDVQVSDIDPATDGLLVPLVVVGSLLGVCCLAALAFGLVYWSRRRDNGASASHRQALAVGAESYDESFPPGDPAGADESMLHCRDKHRVHVSVMTITLNLAWRALARHTATVQTCRDRRPRNRDTAKCRNQTTMIDMDHCQ